MAFENSPFKLTQVPGVTGTAGAKKALVSRFWCCCWFWWAWLDIGKVSQSTHQPPDLEISVA